MTNEPIIEKNAGLPFKFQPSEVVRGTVMYRDVLIIVTSEAVYVARDAYGIGQPYQTIERIYT